jgi:hypothetical protein
MKIFEYICKHQTVIKQQSMKKQTKIKDRPTSNEWMLRVLQAKTKFPKNYMPLFVHYFPEYNSEDDKTTVRQVCSLRKYDANIVCKIEKLAEILKNS